MKKYIAIIRIRFINSLQYRAAAIAGMATQFAWGLMEILAFSAFYRANPAAFPMEFSQTVSYIWMQQALLALFMVWFFEGEIFASITSGGIAYELARPVDLYSRWFCQSMANRLAKAVLRCFPILIVAFIVPEPFRMSLPVNAGQFILFLVSASLSLFVVVSFSMLIYISTFYTLSPMGVRLISAVLADFMAGATIPLPFFPPAFLTVAELMPFAAMQNMPLRIYSGNIAGTDAALGIGLQLFWLLVLVLIGRLLMKNALKRVVVQGG
ncbi:putative ABC transporter permease protein [Desulfofarcimen acetoxidans DSM 771]|uniref:Putative ABC transporter permease protein n=1 Tax=Desulfofarcimen acetoxidans (strain ATCC 49208 / DSM 771 / KCTC 5769 / VKM B-1644 / 5575) TaxID=485916 RepID=C8W522_DESAS|nr:ABC transporter permease [Desulfofarcimen acetoxidans]ACV61374.1 putative ABC transporter permease protein [Desulfofarcimen acetoxidans DSM 771]